MNSRTVSRRCRTASSRYREWHASRPRSSSASCRGFTLVEAIVALLIVALGMTAVFVQLNVFATSTISLREKTLASWIGSNIVTQYSLAVAWPELGNSEDRMDYAGQEWLYSVEVSETDVQNLRRVDVAVSLAERPNRIIHTVSGLIEPPNNDLPPVNWNSVGSGQGPRG